MGNRRRFGIPAGADRLRHDRRDDTGLRSGCNGFQPTCCSI